MGIEAHRGGSTTLIVRSAAMGVRVACIHPGRGRAHASSEQSSSRAVVTGAVKPVTTAIQENADAGRAIISWMPSRLSFSET